MPHVNSMEAAIRRYNRSQKTVGELKNWRKSPRGYAQAVSLLDLHYGHSWPKKVRLRELDEAVNRAGLVEAITGELFASDAYDDISRALAECKGGKAFPSVTDDRFESVQAVWRMIVKELREERTNHRCKAVD